MTAADTITALIAAIESEGGRDLTSWSALADCLADEGYGEGAEADGLRFLCLAVRVALAGHRHTFQATNLLALAGVEGVRKAGRIAGTLLGCHGGPVSFRAAWFASLGRRWPYVGHRNVSAFQQRTYQCWTDALAAADATPSAVTGRDRWIDRVRILCYSVGEVLQSDDTPVVDVTAEAITVRVRGEERTVTWDESREAMNQADRGLGAVYAAVREAVREAARQLARARGIDVPA